MALYPKFQGEDSRHKHHCLSLVLQQTQEGEQVLIDPLLKGSYNTVIGIDDRKNGKGLNLEGLQELVIVDLDYLLDNTESVISIVQSQRDARDSQSCKESAKDE